MPANDPFSEPDRAVAVRADELWTLSEYVDVAAVSAEPGPPDEAVRLVPVTGSSTHVTYRDERTGTDVRLPRFALDALCAGGRIVAAARRLAGPGSLTVGMIGPAPEIWWYAGVLSRALVGITDVVLCVSPPASEERPPPGLVDQLDLAGVGLSVTDDPAATLFGSTLLVAAAPLELTGEQIAPGALVIEAVPGALPTETCRRPAAVLPFGAGPDQRPPGACTVLRTEAGDRDPGAARRVAAALFEAGTRLGIPTGLAGAGVPDQA